ncbi:MAG: ferredoxin family protein, partial [Pygmaiobacter massiliensis]
MAKNWYPVIDYLACTECGTCVDFCSHSVYNKAKAPSPVVMQPGNCIDRCHGCGNKCPAGAISYVGDDTGWTPPNGECSAKKSVDCCRGGACEEDSSK